MFHRQLNDRQSAFRALSRLIMNTTYFIGMYWGKEEMCINDIATKIASSVIQLTATFDFFEFWGSDGKAAVSTDKSIHSAEIQQRLIKQAKKFDISRNIIDEQYKSESGFTISFLVKCGNMDLKFRYTLGCNNKRLNNCIVIENINPSSPLFDLKMAKRLFTLIIEDFPIQWGTYSSDFILNNREISEYSVGWVNYYSNNIALPGIGEGFITEDVLNKGRFIIITNDEFSIQNNAQLSKIYELINLFRKNKVLRKEVVFN